MDDTFRFSDVGKRMPYTAPDGFLDEAAANVLERIRQAPTDKPERTAATRRLTAGWKAVLSAAAVVGILFAVGVHRLAASPAADIRNVEQAFDNLSQTDQTYIMELYQEDEFINE